MASPAVHMVGMGGPLLIRIPDNDNINLAQFGWFDLHVVNVASVADPHRLLNAISGEWDLVGRALGTEDSAAGSTVMSPLD